MLAGTKDTDLGNPIALLTFTHSSIPRKGILAGS